MSMNQSPIRGPGNGSGGGGNFPFDIPFSEAMNTMESYNETKSDVSEAGWLEGSTELEATVEIGNGSFNLSGNIDGVMDISLSQTVRELVTGGGPTAQSDMNVHLGKDYPSVVKNKAESGMVEGLEMLGFDTFIAESLIEESNLSPLDQVGTEKFRLEFDWFVGTKGESPQEFSILNSYDGDMYNGGIRYTPILIPQRVYDEMGDEIMEDLPDINIQVKGRPTSGIRNAMGEALDSLPKVEFNIPSEVYVSVVSLPANIGLDCMSIHTGLFNDIDQFNETIQSAYQRGDGIVNNAKNIRNSVNSYIEGDISNMSSSDLERELLSVISSSRNLSVGDVRGWVEDVREMDEVYDTLEDPESKISDLESRIESETPHEKAEEAGLDCISALMEELNKNMDLISEISGMKEELGSVLDDLDILLEMDNLPGDGNIGACAGAPKWLINEVEGYEESANTMEDKGPIERSIDRVNSLISNADDLKSDVRGQFDEGHPCRVELIRQISRSQNTLDNLRVIDEDDLPCSQQFPDAEEAVSNFEDLADNATPDLIENDVQNIMDAREEAENAINNDVDNDRCIQEFRRRVESSARSFNSVISPVRITEEIENRSGEKRQEMLENIEQLSSEIPEADIPDPDEIVSDYDF